MKKQLVHCSYHKCLTSYFSKTMKLLFNRFLRFSIKRRYKHFSSYIDDFYNHHSEYFLSSINNHYLDFNKLNDFKISRFIRDPRDMIVSGYFYHKKGAENWCNIIGPNENDWKRVNGNLNKNLGHTHSYTSYLNSLSLEDGLIAEIDFRKYHFESMFLWPMNDKRIKVFRYEEIIGNEKDVFEEIFDFYELSWFEKKIGVVIAEKLSASKQIGLTNHIRNPKPGQWKQYFTTKVNNYFELHYSKLLEIYNYN